MCGRVVQVTGPLQVAILCGLDVPDTRFTNVTPRYNAAPSQELWAIRQNHDTGERSPNAPCGTRIARLSRLRATVHFC